MPDVMTFNIRYPQPADGAHVWEKRRDAVIALLRSAKPDVVGMQEPVIEQIEYIADAAPEYGWLGVSRYGNQFEKYTPIFYRREAVAALEWGSFWLSETPDVVASSYPEMEKPRVVTWALFECAGGRKMTVFNTHLQYKPADHEAKLRSAGLIRDRISAVPGPVVLTGDFNHPAGAEVYAALTDGMSDAWLGAAERFGPEGSFHGFTGQSRSSRRIDWILYKGSLRTVSCTTITCAYDGIYPSDHFPVMARLEFHE